MPFSCEVLLCLSLIAAPPVSLREVLRQPEGEGFYSQIESLLEKGEYTFDECRMEVLQLAREDFKTHATRAIDLIELMHELGGIEQSVTDWKVFLKIAREHRNQDVRMRALALFRTPGRLAKAQDFKFAFAPWEQEEFRWHAIRVIGTSEAPDAVDTLLAHLRDSSVRIKIECLNNLSKYPRQKEKITEELLKSLHEKRGPLLAGVESHRAVAELQKELIHTLTELKFDSAEYRSKLAAINKGAYQPEAQWAAAIALLNLEPANKSYRNYFVDRTISTGFPRSSLFWLLALEKIETPMPELVEPLLQIYKLSSRTRLEQAVEAVGWNLGMFPRWILDISDDNDFELMFGLPWTSDMVARQNVESLLPVISKLGREDKRVAEFLMTMLKETDKRLDDEELQRERNYLRVRLFSAILKNRFSREVGLREEMLMAHLELHRAATGSLAWKWLPEEKAAALLVARMGGADFHTNLYLLRSFSQHKSAAKKHRDAIFRAFESEEINYFDRIRVRQALIKVFGEE